MIEQFQQMLPIVIASVIAFNLVLTGLHKGLEVLKDKTESKADDKAWEIIGKIVEITQKIVDYVGMNRAHK